MVEFLPVMKYRRKGEKFLRKYIQERLDGKTDADGEKPQDLVQWLIDAAPPVEKTVTQLAERVMALNVASIHTTTMVSPKVGGNAIHGQMTSDTLSDHRPTFTLGLYGSFVCIGT